jgi:hypothetical protein
MRTLLVLQRARTTMTLPRCYMRLPAVVAAAPIMMQFHG